MVTPVLRNISTSTNSRVDKELSPGDPKQPVPGEGVPGQLELPGVCLRRHSGS